MTIVCLLYYCDCPVVTIDGTFSSCSHVLFRFLGSTAEGIFEAFITNVSWLLSLGRARGFRSVFKESHCRMLFLAHVKFKVHLTSFLIILIRLWWVFAFYRTELISLSWLTFRSSIFCSWWTVLRNLDILDIFAFVRCILICTIVVWECIFLTEGDVKVIIDLLLDNVDALKGIQCLEQLTGRDWV